MFDALIDLCMTLSRATSSFTSPEVFKFKWGKEDEGCWKDSFSPVKLYFGIDYLCPHKGLWLRNICIYLLILLSADLQPSYVWMLHSVAFPI